MLQKITKTNEFISSLKLKNTLRKEMRLRIEGAQDHLRSLRSVTEYSLESNLGHT